eukprot:gene23653-biopygen14886
MRTEHVARAVQMPSGSRPIRNGCWSGTAAERHHANPVWMMHGTTIRYGVWGSKLANAQASKQASGTTTLVRYGGASKQARKQHAYEASRHSCLRLTPAGEKKGWGSLPHPPCVIVPSRSRTLPASSNQRSCSEGDAPRWW